MKISINCPSYKRPRVETLDYLPYCKVWVDEGEYEAYVKSNPQGSNIVSVPKGIQGNLCRIRNYILDKEFERGADVVCIIDDDMKGVYRFEDNSRIEANEFMWFLQRYSLLCDEFGFKLWGINCNDDRISYREYTPFNTNVYVGGPFMCHFNTNIRFDERFPLKEDYDITLQHMNKYRGVLRVNKYFYEVKQSEQKGGCATYRNLDREKEQLKMLQNKWGKDIIRFDFAKNNSQRKKRVNIDYNPILKSKIKGV